MVYGGWLRVVERAGQFGLFRWKFERAYHRELALFERCDANIEASKDEVYSPPATRVCCTGCRYNEAELAQVIDLLIGEYSCEPPGGVYAF